MLILEYSTKITSGGEFVTRAIRCRMINPPIFHQHNRIHGKKQKTTTCSSVNAIGSTISCVFIDTKGIFQIKQLTVSNNESEVDSWTIGCSEKHRNLQKATRHLKYLLG